MSDEGKLADFADLGQVDDWSKDFFTQFRDWVLPCARASWSTWAPGYLLLDLTLARGDEVSEPASICSADEELRFTTRVWRDHNPHRDFPERWFGGNVATYNPGDAWKGSLTVAAEADKRAALVKGINWVRV